MKKYIILSVITVLSLSSCYKEKEIHADPGEPRYTIEDSDDPLDHAIYEIYRKTGVHILYTYELNDYLWDLGSLRNSENRLTMQTDRAVLLEGLTYLDQVLFSVYQDAFKQGFFPLKIFLADSIDLQNTTAREDLLCASGREYIVIGRLRAGGIPSTAAEITTAQGLLNAHLWANLIIKNRLLVLPDAFSEISSVFYGANYRYVKGQQQGVGATDIPYPTRAQLMDEGFWDIEQSNSQNFPIQNPNTGVYNTYAMMPTYEGDIYQFVQMITTRGKTELMTLMEGHEKIITKYNILVQAIKDQCEIDLQEIGNSR
ncbi:MAG: hypothetical protein LBI96_03740 [Odoribacteraceae bacterium]|jgi:hypothetical protein|nr:hypothetical protein [Odoribacteraceae bacterium]